MKSGIYEIVNTINGKRYIGSTQDFKNRWSGHRTLLKKEVHHCQPLQAAWNKYGSEAFIFKVLIVCGVDMLIDYEQRLINGLKPYYNVCKIAGRTTGYRHDEERREKMRAAALAMSPEKRAAIRAGQDYRNPDRRKKLSFAASNRSAEVRKNMSDSRKGKKLTEAQKEALSKANKGKVLSEAHKKKIGVANKGKSPSQEARAKMSAAHKGRALSEKHRQAIQDAHIARRNRLSSIRFP